MKNTMCRSVYFWILCIIKKGTKYLKQNEINTPYVVRIITKGTTINDFQNIVI